MFVIARGPDLGGFSVLSGVTFTILFLAYLVAHQIGDHWVQTDRQTADKGEPGWQGRLACAQHVTTYTLTTSAFGVAVWWAFSLPISVQGFALGQGISALTHYWIDRRFTLAHLAHRLGKLDFYNMGAPRPGRDDNPTLGTGSYALDQSAHWFWLFVAAFVTAAEVP
ncbi:hypothetical protein GCM10012275_64480 [Longimycelium tulufanense]|uniref:DUF3307 domain-containing protein n=1 Tax=Longimycelium tulufanense TaxID=907463 RepID=A0A8J3FZX6_9PSEU|nr:DUF3307 domain-containing protein [Longimycelium tulufanense]GGM84835.1 hypothetical protein GCM10012275_64480 [Longimycelium tulufanense]